MTGSREQSSSRRRSSVSSSIHRRFPDVQSYVSELGGAKAFAIEKVLIANNGVAAVKAIRSIRKWAYEVFGDERAISFVVMATPEDLRANAEYIRMGDTIVDVPGGSNNHNYANVTLIVELARLHGVQAVWAGWGHASENPLLPDTLARSNPTIKFIGPMGPPMRALGDKIGSTIIAQSAGVPCIAWNGNGIKAVYSKETGCLPDETYKEATIKSVTEATTAASEIGFPVMIKASEGGGGKGIRKVSRIEEVPDAYRQVCGEVPGSPIFIMKLSDKSRHLEVQLLADEYGDAVALNGRDCSVQRRHQKIIEEGPPVAAPPEIWSDMEQAAVSLARTVGYANAGTVEYLYNEASRKFYFLELNPRLQVEHPVTEMITGVNLPAAQLQVAMGIPLRHIPEIRELYGKKRFEDDNSKSFIDFAAEKRVEPRGHCIAVRITAENAEAGFKPTSGGIQELNFRSTPSVWGYFSMDSSGSIHEFADSQFGHLFASGPDREQARRNMVLALKELSIRGDISTTVDYISKLIELDDFVENRIDTAWLDELIKKNASGLVAAEKEEEYDSPQRSEHGVSRMKKNDLNNHTYVVIGATIMAYDRCISGEKQFMEALEKGQLPPRTLLSVTEDVELILDGVKYKTLSTRTGENTFAISLARVGLPENTVNGNQCSHVNTNVRILSDGGYLIALGEKSHVAYLTKKGDAGTGMRLNIGGANVAFSPDYDPASLRTDVAGKLVKKLFSDGSHVTKGEPYAEIEVMKMFMPLKVEETGTLTWHANEGAALAPGDLLASLELDNPENVATPVTFSDDLDVDGWVSSKTAVQRNAGVGSENRNIVSPHILPHILLRRSVERLQGGIAGYVLTPDDLRQTLLDLRCAATDVMLPVFEIDEQLSVLSGRIDSELYADLVTMISDFRRNHADQTEGCAQQRFPANVLDDKISNYIKSIENGSDHSAFLSVISPLREAISPYVKEEEAGATGSERALACILELLREWIANERWFCDGMSYADSVDKLRKANKADLKTVLKVCRAHAQVISSSQVVLRLIDIIGESSRSLTLKAGNIQPLFGPHTLLAAEPCLAEIRNMGGNETHAAVALKARRVLLQESLPSITLRKTRVLQMMSKIALSCESGNNISGEVQAFAEENTSLADIFFPILRSSPAHREQTALLEIFARRLFRSYLVEELASHADDLSLQLVFMSKPGESVFSASTPVTSMTDLTRIVSRSSSMDKLGELQESESETNLLRLHRENRAPPLTPRAAVIKIIDTLEELEGSCGLETVARICDFFSSRKSQAGPINILHIVVRQPALSSDAMDGTAAQCQDILSSVTDVLRRADIRRVSFIIGRVPNADGNDDVEDFPVPAIFTYREMHDFKEDSLFRHIEPGLAYQLELTRLSKNFHLQSLDSRHMTTGHVHIYRATPKAAALAKDTKANKSSRIFVRALSFVVELTQTGFERILVDSLNALDLSGGLSNDQADNHLFINMVSDHDKVVDASEIEQVVASILKRHSERIARLGLAEVETRVVCCLTEDSPPISIRMVASNPTGYVHVMNTYVESADDTGTKRVYRLIGGTKASLACSGDSSWEGMDVDTPYPLTRPFDTQRKAAMKASDTLYCYDIPALFEAAVEQQWSEAALKAAGNYASCRPLMVMYTTELVVQKKIGVAGKAGWTMDDYLNGDLELSQIHRKAGSNDVGMVAWLMVLKTVEYPEGRQLVIIANDITHKAGSFGTREDVVFKLASEFAREKRIPRLFVAANSGARIGTANGVKKVFKAKFKDATKPENGFEYLYVSRDERDRLGNAIITEPISFKTESGEIEEVFKITDIIGTESDLGVENLKGSGLIAGETSSAYNDIFTMTIVLGRTVGIGAYLVRLGQRTIQKISACPIILTGYQALNKLMGCEVYSTNDQLGGPGIMYSNGVSHLVANDHLSAVMHAVQWLSYVPCVRGGLLPIAGMNGVDEVERSIDFTPMAGVPYDPRHLVAGLEDDSGVWKSGFFDRGSFTEMLAGWAKSVIVGRARLGGIPMGVIITENRTAEAVKPADPADLKASEAIIQEAGCVWFPNSAYKTAQAINDFRTEDLPLIIFANWRGFSGGQRDMFDEVLKYGSLIVDAFVAYEQPVFVYIPPHGEIRGGAWVVLDSSINASVMEMYAATGTARGGVLEANGAASVKYRTKDLLVTMHRLDEKLKALSQALLDNSTAEDEKQQIQGKIARREQALLPVYEQLAVHFCELHDTPGRMKAVGVIERDVEWKEARRFFFWRLRRKLAEFDLRKKIQQAGEVGRGITTLTPLEASSLVREWFLDQHGSRIEHWENDKMVLNWMAENYEKLDEKVKDLTKNSVAQEVFQVMTAGGQTEEIGTAGLVEGMQKAYRKMTKVDKERFKTLMKSSFDL